MSFTEIKAEELKDNPFDLIGKQWMLITAGNEEKCNTMTASWGGVGIMIFVCKKVYVQRMGEENFVEKANLDKWYADKDMHNMYMGEIKKILVKED